MCREIPYLPVMQAFLPFVEEAQAHLLGAGHHARASWGGEWEYIVAAPTQVLSCRDGVVSLNGTEQALAPDETPFDVLQRLLAAREGREVLSADDVAGLPLPDFQGGALGMIAYEAAAWLEPSLELPRAEGPLPEFCFGFYDTVAAFHAETERAFVYGRDETDVLKLVARFQAADVSNATQPAVAENVSTAQVYAAYMAHIKKIKEYILQGDIFQANMTQQLSAQFAEVSDFAGMMATAFQKLKEQSSAGFMALLQMEAGMALSNSPEQYFTVSRSQDALKVTAAPVKGTRQRDSDPERDQKLADELLSNEKDRAENIMIADLVRNDLSRVCEDHSICEEEICALRSYGHVHHLVSVISGALRAGLGAVDVLKASFPCGSITGAPKIRAMEVIAERERQGRGVYCGAIGYISDHGAAAFSVPIRTAVADLQNQSLSYGTGGGITVLSDPQTEYEEIITKAGTFFALTGTGREAVS